MAQYCPYCGAALEEGFIFCEKCGKRVPVKTEPAQASAASQQPEVEQPQSNPADSAVKPGASYAIALKLIIAVIIAIVGSFLLYFFGYHTPMDIAMMLLVPYAAIIMIGCLAGIFLLQNRRQWLWFAGALALNFVVLCMIILAEVASSSWFISSYGRLICCFPLSCLLSLTAPFCERYGKKRAAGILWCLAGFLLLILTFWKFVNY